MKKKENIDIKIGIVDDERNPQTLGTIDIPSQQPPVPELKLPEPIPYKPAPPLEVKIGPPSGIIQRQVVKDGLRSMRFAYLQGDEDQLENDILDWFLADKPEIIFYCNWVVGITVYILFIYR